MRVSWQVEGDRCALRIADDGIGMAPEKLERLFEPFNRLGAENSKIEGTGIGLVLSRRLVELMRGELRIESALGRGTEASLTLACAAEAPAQIGGASPPSQHGTLDESLRVLYAEDNEVNVEIVREVVKLRPSVALDVAESGALAFKKARRDQPQLILVDMNLGDMTGIELAQALHADPATSGHPAGRPVGGRPARADRCGARHGIRGLPDQADQLPGSARCAGRAASSLTLGFRKRHSTS